MTFSNYWELKTRQDENRSLPWWGRVESRGCQCLFAELEWRLGPAKSKEEMEESVLRSVLVSGRNYNTRPRHCTRVEEAGWKQKDCLTNSHSVWKKDTRCLWQLCCWGEKEAGELVWAPSAQSIKLWGLNRRNKSSHNSRSAQVPFIFESEMAAFYPSLHIASPLKISTFHLALLRQMPVIPESDHLYNLILTHPPLYRPWLQRQLHFEVLGDRTQISNTERGV